MQIICLGPKNSGKTLLLSNLSQPGSVNFTSNSVATVGTNIFTIKVPGVIEENDVKKTFIKKVIQVREVGGIIFSNQSIRIHFYKLKFSLNTTGSMAPMWKNYFNDVEKIMYVVDTSNLCQITAAGVLLYSILAEPRLQKVKVLLILSKMDLAYRQMRNEALLMLQIEKLKKQVRQNITIVQASAITGDGNDKIYEWLC